jgi:hypothetical protein
MDPALPLWLKLAYGAGFAVVAVSYWRAYGPANYLWLSDIAFALTTIAVIAENPLPVSMAVIGALPFEIVWMIDFVTGGRLIGIAAYMFDAKLSLYLRLLSSFHLALPPTWLWMLLTFGYDARALPLQIALSVAALIGSVALVSRKQNVNWVYGPGPRPQRRLPPRLYFGIVLLTIGVVAPLAMHMLMQAAFAPA